MVMTSIHNLLLSVAALSSTPTPITLDRSLLDECKNCSKISTFFRNCLRHEEVKQDMFGFALCVATTSPDVLHISRSLSCRQDGGLRSILNTINRYHCTISSTFPALCVSTKGRWTNIPDICHFFYTHTFSGLKILHSKVRKFATKIASRQNSVNQYWEVKFTFIFLAATFDHEIMKRKGRLALPP